MRLAITLMTSLMAACSTTATINNDNCSSLKLSTSLKPHCSAAHEAGMPIVIETNTTSITETYQLARKLESASYWIVRISKGRIYLGGVTPPALRSLIDNPSIQNIKAWSPTGRANQNSLAPSNSI